MEKDRLKILSIESSCDESGLAVIEDGREIIFNSLASQADIHARFGGIVPEIASRQHLLTFPKLLKDYIENSAPHNNIDAISVTYGPGLAGSLLVGVNFAKALSLSWDLPVIGVHHLEGHIYANWIRDGQWDGEIRGDPVLPAVALVVSGGHTDLVFIETHDRYKIIGQTRDDAAGEAFDKVARILGLRYPGGPEIERLATQADKPVVFPKPAIKKSWDFSFSGIKTAVLRFVQKAEKQAPLDDMLKINIAAGFQQVSVDALAERLVEAARVFGAKSVILSGGVAANQALRSKVLELSDLPLWCPKPSLCTDNAAMIGARARFLWDVGVRHGMDMDAVPNLRMPYDIGAE